MLGLPGPVTHRQLLTWAEWLDADLNRPSRGDHYAMQAALATYQANAKDPTRFTLADMRIEFKRPAPTPAVDGATFDPAKAAAARWRAVVKGNPGYRFTPAPGAAADEGGADDGG